MRRPLAVLLAFLTLVAAFVGLAAGTSGATPREDETTTTTIAVPTTTTTLAVPPLPADYVTHRSKLYNNPAHWLCLPGRTGDACDVNLDATVVNADGTTSIEKHVKATAPKIDCFYVYPTISSDPTVNSDFHPDAPEVGIVRAQFARLDSSCRMFAPVYRQRTLAGLFGTAIPNPPGRTPDVGYSDAVDAFKQYVANYSKGRGFVLIGHSQGAGVLDRLIAAEIDKVPALRARLVSAITVGASVTVPNKTAVVGGSFQNIPLCRRTGQIGCVITFASFRATAPPPANSFFGRGSNGGVAGCANPAALGGSNRELSPYFLTTQGTWLSNPAANAKIKTTWVKLPGLLKGQCVHLGGFSYLRVQVKGNPADPRTDDIPGDITPVWGLHLVDLTITAGDVEREVAAEAKTYVG